MGKKFDEVFPTLNLPEYYRGLFGQADIQHVKYTKDKTGINVYLFSEKLLEKKDIYYIQDAIEKQIFPDSGITVRIYEAFRLSKQYSLSNLIDTYKESILLEFHQTSEVDYNLLRKAEWCVEDNRLVIKAVESPLFQLKKDDMKQHLMKVLTDRCAIDASVEFEFTVNEELNRSREDELEYTYRKKHSQPKASNVNDGVDLPFDLPEAVDSGDKTITETKDAKQTAKEDPAPKTENTKASPKQETSKTDGKGSFKGKGYEGGKKYGGRNSYQKSNDPDIVYGRSVDGELIPISEIQSEMGEVMVRGEVVSYEERPIKNEKFIVTFAITDFTDTIKCKIFATGEQLEELRPHVQAKCCVVVKGITSYDRYDKELELVSLNGIKKAGSIRTKREDHCEKKRVELHLHTNMSENDGMSDIKDMIKLAKSWGHTAMAVTDHGGVYAFPLAAHALEKKDSFKVIYGVEGYLVDDTKDIVSNLTTQEIMLDDTCVVYDIETTGFSSVKNQIIEFGAVKIRNGEVIERFSEFVNPLVPIPYRIEQLTSINDSMVQDAEDISGILPKFLAFISDAKYLVAHNANFDIGFVTQKAKDLDLPFQPVYVDTVGLSRFVLPHLGKFKLDNVAKELGIPPFHHHRAVDDAEATAQIYIELIKRLHNGWNIQTLADLKEKAVMSASQIQKMPSYHIILLAKNDVGRVNLYKLVSESHLKYYHMRPRIPRSRLMALREGIIVGSACEAGELFQAVLRGESGEVISKIVDFYDYLEIQPIGNNAFMMKNDKHNEGNGVETEEDLRNLNREIVRLGEQYDKPVVATCDVHFMNPEDEIYRRIIMHSKKYDDADSQPPLYLRTTEEMLKEFDYLGADKCEEVVITNTNLIADCIEYISPVRPDKCPPVIEDSDNILRTLCYENAHKTYGPNLPQIVEERLEKELHSIISNGFAVMYIIAQKLVKKSNDDGYLVGSRGSVGSSFVAAMAGITEVNSLSPHYLCEKCYYVDFYSEEVKAFSGGAGCDMPDKICPQCGAQLTKQGFDIPFETFLGFKGDKEPDIDLNFSSEYQSKAHDYTEVIFGSGQTFRAGTIGCIADNTAFGLVKKYYEEHNIEKRACEIVRLSVGCTGVRRTSGQHPGGIIVLPVGENINTFTPVQHPANDMTTNTITTHFDYHSIDHNLLKLDILGHQDPTMIKMLGDLTQLDMAKIPLDSPEVMSLFMNTSALKITPEDIGGTKLGALGIPEFGTDFAIQMLLDAKPTKFSDLVRIAGLAHGTDVWLGNAQTLIQEGKADISTAICTRDDIMIYLIGMGLDPSLSFTIMESVRKGKGLKPEWEEEMLKHDVPDWYIWSCKKIQYMFPKAHAAAYVMMAWRVAYCKVFYPLAYYTAYFSIRATSFNYELMCRGHEHLNRMIADYKARKNELSNKEDGELHDMRIVQEMYARGYDFMPIDIYRAKATRFQIIDGKIMPSFASIEGMGDKAAEGLEIAAANGEFLSKDDLKERSKITTTCVEKLSALGLLEGLPESNQISLFDFT